MQIRQETKEAIKSNNRIVGRLMILFDRGQKTIENWLDNDDIRFTTPAAMDIIKTETGLTEAEILEPQTATAN